MDFIIQLLTDPKILSLLSLPTICMLVLGFALYKLFQKYDKLQNLRVDEARKMNEEYNQLVSDINKTLDTVLRVINHNGNGGSK